MTTYNTIQGNLRVTGNLVVSGSKPAVARTDLTLEQATVHVIAPTRWRVHDALQTNLPGTAATDDLALVGGTFGSASPTIQSGDLKALGVATTRYARCQVELPPEYVAGETVQLRASARMNGVSDGTATLDLEAHQVDREGGVSSDLCATIAQDINAAPWADVTFTITATALTPGDLLDLRLAVTVNDAASGSAVVAEIGAVELLLDVKG